MCGIAGQVGSWTPALTDAMTAAIAHRGPDGSGAWFEDGVALGHRRLSIIDLSDAAAQPMQTVDARLTRDVFDVLSVKQSVASRTSFGGTAPRCVLHAVEQAKERYL